MQEDEMSTYNFIYNTLILQGFQLIANMCFNLGKCVQIKLN